MLLDEAKRVTNYELDGRFTTDSKNLPTSYDTDWIKDTINLIVKLGDESKLKPEYKYHRDGDIHIVHIPDPSSYQRNPLTGEFYKFSDWLILFKTKETKKFKNYYFVRTGTHEYLKIKQENE